VETIAKNLKNVADLAHKAGPYLLLEILLPGGTLFALLLFIYRARTSRVPFETVAPPAVVHAMRTARRGLIAVQPYDIAAVANSDAANDDGLGPLAMVPGR
jgi:hypothetical protein